jgi:hypothetical protein
MNTRLARYAIPAAYITGIMSILGFVSLILFFALEAPQASTNPQGFHFWGFVSDISGPATMLPLLVVILALHEIERARAPLLSRIAAAVGVIGALAVTVLQVLLVIKVLPFEQEDGPVVLAMAAVGLWLVLANYLGRVQRVLPSGLAWLGIVAGAAQVLYPVLFQALGGSGFYENIGSNYLLMAAASVIFLVSYVGFPVWAIWLGRVSSSQRVKAHAGAAYAG